MFSRENRMDSNQWARQMVCSFWGILLCACKKQATNYYKICPHKAGRTEANHAKLGATIDVWLVKIVHVYWRTTNSGSSRVTIMCKKSQPFYGSLLVMYLLMGPTWWGILNKLSFRCRNRQDCDVTSDGWNFLAVSPVEGETFNRRGVASVM